jgi:hypothetical protein
VAKNRLILEPHPLTIAIGVVLLAFAVWGVLSPNAKMVVTAQSLPDTGYIECGSVLSPSMADAHGQGFRQDLYSTAQGRVTEYEALYVQACDDKIRSTTIKFGVIGGLGAILTTWYVVRRRKYLEDEKKRSDETA